MNRIRLSVLALAISGAVVSTAALAQQPDPGHPRVNEIDHRVDAQQDAVNNLSAKGQLNAKQAARDQAVNARIQQRSVADEAKHGGHLTKREQRNLNKSLNHRRHVITHQRRYDRRK